MPAPRCSCLLFVPACRYVDSATLPHPTHPFACLCLFSALPLPHVLPLSLRCNLPVPYYRWNLPTLTLPRSYPTAGVTFPLVPVFVLIPATCCCLFVPLPQLQLILPAPLPDSILPQLLPSLPAFALLILYHQIRLIFCDFPVPFCPCSPSCTPAGSCCLCTVIPYYYCPFLLQIYCLLPHLQFPACHPILRYLHYNLEKNSRYYLVVLVTSTISVLLPLVDSLPPGRGRIAFSHCLRTVVTYITFKFTYPLSTTTQHALMPDYL